MLTLKQLQLFDFLTDYIKENRIAPTFDEMKKALNLKSQSGIFPLLNELKNKGYIHRERAKTRCIVLLKNKTKVKVVKPATSIAWQPFPNEQPSQDDMYKEFAVLYNNPYFSKKTFYANNHRPAFNAETACWNGKSFFNSNYNEQPLYWHPLPPFPEVK